MKNKIFYVQILLVLAIIMLSLSYEVVRNMKDSIVLWNQSPYVYWMGIKIHISFLIDLVLMLLLTSEVSLMLLIIEEKLRKVRE